MSLRPIPCLLLFPALASAQIPWTTYQANARHDGALPVTLHPATLVPRWQRSLGTGQIQQVTAADGKVFASGPNRKLFVLDASTGNDLWNIEFSSAFSVNPPAYHDGKVYIQTCNHSSDTYLRCYDADTGALVFQAPHTAQWERYLAPTIVGNVVYVNGGYYGGMYAFRADNGQQLWFQSALPQYDEWTPAVENGVAYAYIGGALYALNAATGAQLYTITDPGFSWAGWSMNLAPVLGGANDAFIVHSGRLVRFDLLSHTIAYSLGPGYTGQPAVKDGVVYAIAASSLRALDRSTGALLWSWSDPVEQLNGAVVATERHVLARSNNKTFLIDTETHLSVWDTASAGQITVGEGAIYIAGANGTLRSIGFDALPTPTSVVPSHTHYTDLPIQVTISGSGFSLGQDLTVRIGGIEVGDLQIIDDHTLTCTVPAHGPGLTDIVVANSIGQSMLANSFAYTPAVHAGADPHPGGSVTLSFFQPANEAIVGAWGTDSVAVPVPPFIGELLLAPPHVLFVLPSWVQPRFDVVLPIPANPTLSGAQMLFQALVGTDIGQGVATFSNVELVTVL